MADISNTTLSTPPPERQMEAVNRLIASGEFSRSPNLEKLFRYLTQEYLAGRSSELKEFTVATEALGRSVDFDPKRDSIVRVEMHRLRRRLREYYAGRGRDEAVHISVPEKSYSPEFIYAATVSAPTPAPPPPPAQEHPETLIPPAPLPPPPRKFPRPIAWGVLATLSLVLLAYFFWPASPRPAAALVPATLPSTALSTPPPQGEEIRILAGRGGGRYVDRFGQAWQADQYASGGTVVAVNKEIRTLGLDPNLFAGMREGDFSYNIPLPNRPHELTLYFAETEYGGENPLGGADASRTFHVEMNGKPLLSNFDVIGSGGDWGTASARVFRDVRPAPDGKLHLRFLSSYSGKAFVNAIELRPGIPGRLRPIRLVCQAQGIRDSQNQYWQPNVYFRGGKQITRPMGPPVERDSDLFRGERFGRFNFAIPVTPGSYTVKLYFWEYWWGPGRPGSGGRDSRRFSVFANFKPLLEDLDIIRATDQNQFLIKSFSGIRPDSESRISLDFVPNINNAMLNALEILDEGKP